MVQAMEISDVFKSQHHQKLDGPLNGRNKESNNNIGNCMGIHKTS